MPMFPTTLVTLLAITFHLKIRDASGTEECASSPCGNGTCLEGIGNYTCLCPPGEFGLQCEVALATYCTPETCGYGGTCFMRTKACDASQNLFCLASNSPVLFGSPSNVEVALTVDCVCFPGYTGLNCETDIDECASSPCLQGPCVDGVANFTCLCPPEVLGPRCQFDLTEYCTPETCQHGGSCDLAMQVCDFSQNISCTTGDDPVYIGAPFDAESAMTVGCVCPAGYTGLHCEKEVDECASNPCRNNGTCVDQFNGFLCQCTSKYSGEVCHIPQPPCHYMDILCANGGSCEDFVTVCDPSDPDSCLPEEGVMTYCIERESMNITECYPSSTGFVCLCTLGWDGVYCEHDIDECLPGPCDNGGACTHGIGYFSCQCPLPYYALRCEARTACAYEPCVNWGVCVDSLSFCPVNCSQETNCTQGSSPGCQPECGQNSSDPLCGQIASENSVQYSYECLCIAPYFGGENCEIIYSCPCAHELSSDGLSCQPLVAAPKLEILCVQNCSKRRAVNKTLSLWVSCENCDPTTEYSYYWTVNTTFDWQINTTTGNSAAGISILGGVLLPPQTYLFSVKVWNSSCQFVYSSTTYSLTLGDPPYPGQCEVAPVTGTVLVDDFSMTCEGFHDEDWPLLYSYYYSPGDTDLTQSYGSILTVRADPHLPPTPLPLASALTNYTGYLTVKCSDKYGSSVAMHYPVQVLPVSDPDQLISLSEDVILSANGNQSNPNKMEALLQSGDSDGALNLALTFTSALNSMDQVDSEPLNSRLERRQVSQDITQLRNGIVDTLVSIDTSSPENVQQKALAMKEITSKTGELTQTAQDSAVASFSNMTKGLKQMLQDSDEQTVSVKPGEIIRDLLAGSFQILKQNIGDTKTATDSTGTRAILQAAKSRSKDITKSSMEVMDDSASILLNLMVPGEVNPNVGEDTGSVSMVLSKDSAYRLSQTSVSVGSTGATGAASGASGRPAGEFDLPLIETGTGDLGDLLGIQAFHLAENPYAWDESSSDLTADVVGLRVTSGGQQDVCLAEPVNFSLPLTQQAFLGAKTYFVVGNLSNEQIADNRTTVTSNITLDDITTLKIVIPRNRDYMVTIGSPVVECLNDTTYTGENVTLCYNQAGDLLSSVTLDGNVTVAGNISVGENVTMEGLPGLLSLYVMVAQDIKPTLDTIQSQMAAGQYLSLCINPLETLIHSATPETLSITSVNNTTSVKYYVNDISRGEIRLYGQTPPQNENYTIYLTLLWDHSLSCQSLGNHLSFNDTALGVLITNGTVVEDLYNLTNLLLAPPINKTVTVATNLPRCLYWDEEGDTWSGEGCWVSPLTTTSRLHCQCSHLTAFSGGIFVVPNLVDPIGDVVLFLTVLDNPVVVSIVLLVWIIYILLVLWARRKDRLDFVQVGVTELEDNNPLDRQCYLVTVLTGWQGGAGTTSTVTLTLEGRRTRSAPHVLTDPHRILFEAAAENWFLIRCPENLGDLISVDIWHDCSGPFPQWFLTQITVRDVKTTEEWHFVCNNWLTPDQPESVRQILRPLSAAKDQPFTYRFSVKAVQAIRDQHLWLSIFMRPPHSSFTRVQRLSCGLSFILTAMLINLMFYGRGTDPDDTIEVRGVQISLSQIVIGIQAAFIAIPINMLIVYMFRNARFKQSSLAETSPINSLESIESVSYRGSRAWPHSDILSGNAGTGQDVLEGSDFTDAAASREYRHGKGNQETLPTVQRTGKRLSSYPGALANPPATDIVVTPRRKPLLFTSTPVRTVSAKSVTISECSEPHVPGKEYPMSNRRDLGTLPLKGILREQETSFMSFDSVENDTLTSMYSCPSPYSDSLLDDAIEDDTMISCHSSSASFHSALERDPHLLGLPWWCRNVAWVVVITTAVVFSYFVMLYGLKFGYAKSVAWCVSFFTSFFQSAGVVQPLKVALITAIFSLIFIEPVRPQWNQVNYRPLKHDEVPLHSCTRPEEVEPIPPELYQPPELQKVLSVASRIRKERKMWQTFYDTSLYLLFSVVLYLVAHGHTHPLAYRNTMAVQNMVISGLYSPATVVFKTVRTKEQMWSYLTETLIPAVITTDPPLAVDRANIILGKVRLRQQRVKQADCHLPPLIAGVYGKPCVFDLQSGTQDTADYTSEWSAQPNNITDSPWLHTDGEGDTVPGRYRRYGSGGYTLDFPRNQSAALATISQLRNQSWVDKHTRAVLVEFSIFNPATKLFVVTTLVFECLTSGGTMPHFSMFTCKLLNLTTLGDLFTLASEVVYMLMVLVYMHREVKKAQKSDLVEYFSDPWTWLHIVILLLSWLTFVVFIYRLVLVSRLFTLYTDHRGDVFLPVYRAAVWDRLLTYFLASNATLVTVYFTRLLKFNKRMLVLGETVRQCFKPLLTYLMVVILSVGGVLVIGFITLGPFCEDYSTVAHSLMSIMSISLRQSGLRPEECLEIKSLLAPVYVVSVGALFIAVFIPLLQSVLFSVLATKKEWIHMLEGEFQMLEFVWARMLVSLGLWKLEKFTEHVEKDMVQGPRRRGGIGDLRRSLPTGLGEPKGIQGFGIASDDLKTDTEAYFADMGFSSRRRMTLKSDQRDEAY